MTFTSLWENFPAAGEGFLRFLCRKPTRPITLLSRALYRLLFLDIFTLGKWINHHSYWIVCYMDYLSFRDDVRLDRSWQTPGTRL